MSCAEAQFEASLIKARKAIRQVAEQLTPSFERQLQQLGEALRRSLEECDCQLLISRERLVATRDVGSYRVEIPIDGWTPPPADDPAPAGIARLLDIVMAEPRLRIVQVEETVTSGDKTHTAKVMVDDRRHTSVKSEN